MQITYRSKMSKVNRERELLTKPGDTILETIAFLKMSQAELAIRTGKSPAKVNDLISGKAPITVNTAMQLEKVLGIDMQFWLNREMHYREKLARIEQEEFLAQCIDWLKEQPIKELQRFGYLKTIKIGTKMVEECLQFYGVVSPVEWQNIYIDSYSPAESYGSRSAMATLSSMAAWLRMGELSLRKQHLPAFDREAFKAVLMDIKTLVEKQPVDFPKKVQAMCGAAGVSVIYSNSLPKAPITGASRWIGGTPLIQITDRYSTNDHFWFTFYHEAGHILLHGKKEVFIEDFDKVENDVNKENEADDFAFGWLLPDIFLDDISAEIDEQTIQRIAKAYSTHPAIVLGRLQHLKKVPEYFGVSLKIEIDLNYFIDY